MKRIVLVLLVLAGFCVNANAQFFATGTLGFNYRNDAFSMKVLPGAGYEFNDRWAVGAEIGVRYAAKHARGLINPYLRFNFWNNEKVFLDLKAASDIDFGKHYTNVFAGLKPSLRYAVNDQLQLAVDMGALGVDINDGEVSPALGLFINGVDLTLIYKF
jgi:hypothetical protein